MHPRAQIITLSTNFTDFFLVFVINRLHIFSVVAAQFKYIGSELKMYKNKKKKHFDCTVVYLV